MLEEAQNFIPQQLKWPEQKEIWWEIDRLIAEGRGQGIGFDGVSQRPAKINKDSLTQIESLFVLGMSGPQDLAQVGEWFKYHARDKAQVKQILESIASLPRGEAWVLSPTWMQMMEPITVRRRVTYHSGRTPRQGEKPVNVKKFEIGDVAARFRQQLEEHRAAWAAQQATSADLKKRLATAERELAAAQRELQKKGAAQVTVPGVTRPAGLSQRDVEKRIGKAIAHASRSFDLPLRKLLIVRGALNDAIQGLSDLSLHLVNELGAISPDSAESTQPKPNGHSLPAHSFNPPAREAARARAPSAQAELTGGALNMVRVLAGWAPEGLTLGQLAAQAQLKMRGGAWFKYLRQLRASGYTAERDGLWYATDAGIEAIGSQAQLPPSSTDEVVNRWKPKLPSGARKILDLLVSSPERVFSDAELAEALAMAPRGGAWAASKRALRSSRLALFSKEGMTANRETLLL